jgi:hypothetical protein
MVRHDLRQEPGAVIPLAGICAGGWEQSQSLPRPQKTKDGARVPVLPWTWGGADVQALIVHELLHACLGENENQELLHNMDGFDEPSDGSDGDVADSSLDICHQIRDGLKTLIASRNKKISDFYFRYNAYFIRFSTVSTSYFAIICSEWEKL